MADVTRKLSERVATEILEMITLQKRFSPGDKIPTEKRAVRRAGGQPHHGAGGHPEADRPEHSGSAPGQGHLL